MAIDDEFDREDDEDIQPGDLPEEAGNYDPEAEVMIEDDPAPAAAAPQEQAAAEYGAAENLADPASAKPLPDSYLLHVGRLVCEQGQMDYNSFEAWREKRAKHLKLHNGDVSDSIPDQENITPMHLPYAKRTVRMFKSKMYPSLFPSTGEIMGLRVQSPHLEEIAARCSAHMNMQLANQCLEYVPSHDRGMTQSLIEGCIFEVWYYDPIEERPMNEICLAEDCWISYKHKSDRPDMKDVPRITWRMYRHQHELEQLEDLGYYAGVTKGDNPLFREDSYDQAGAALGGQNLTHMDSLSDRPVKEAQDAYTGHEQQIDDPDAPREVLEQDRLLKLPGETRQRAVTVCVDRATQRVMRLTLRERENLKDKKRFHNESMMREQQIASANAMYSSAQQAWEGQARQLLDSGVPPEQVPEGPRPPQPPPEPRPVKREPWPRWTRIDCEVNPEGALGLGVLDDVAGHNILADKIATRAVSLLTLNMMKTGLISRHTRFTRGEVQLKLGKLNEVGMSPVEVERGAGITWLDFPSPDPQWVKVLELEDQATQSVSAFDVVMGAPGKSGETATESENRNSSATANISVISGRYNRGRAYSLKNLAYINSQTLPEEGVVVYMDADLTGDASPAMPPGAATGGMPQAPATPPGMGMGPPPDLGAPPPEMMGAPPPGAPGPAGPMDPMAPQPIPAPVRPPKVPVIVTRADYEAILDELQVTFTCDPEMESKAVKERRAMKMFQTALQVATTAVAPGMSLIDPGTTITIMRAVAAKTFQALDMPRDLTQMILKAPMPMMPMGPPPQEGEGSGEGMEQGGPGSVPGQSGGPPP